MKVLISSIISCMMPAYCLTVYMFLITKPVHGHVDECAGGGRVGIQVCQCSGGQAGI